MKSAVRALIAVILVGMVVAGALIYFSVPKAPRPVQPVEKFVPGGTVYADISKLVPLHPSYDFVRQSRMVMSGVSERMSSGASEQLYQPISPVRIDIRNPVVSREDLESETVWSAVQSLTQWENRLKQALKVQLEGSWKKFRGVANSEIRLATVDIEAEATEERRKVIMRYLYPRVNAYAKFAAAEKAARIPGFESPYLKQAYETAKAEYDKLMAQYTSELSAIDSQAKQRIATVRKESMQLAQTRFAADERKGIRDINQRIAVVREEIVNDTELASAASRKTGIDLKTFRQSTTGQPLAVPQPPPSVSIMPVVPVDQLTDAIQKNVKQAVEMIAREKRVAVVFVPGTAADATALFQREMKSKLWWGQGPVLAEVGGKLKWK